MFVKTLRLKEAVQTFAHDCALEEKEPWKDFWWMETDSEGERRATAGQPAGEQRKGQERESWRDDGWSWYVSLISNTETGNSMKDAQRWAGNENTDLLTMRFMQCTRADNRHAMVAMFLLHFQITFDVPTAWGGAALLLRYVWISFLSGSNSPKTKASWRSSVLELAVWVLFDSCCQTQGVVNFKPTSIWLLGVPEPTRCSSTSRSSSAPVLISSSTFQSSLNFTVTTLMKHCVRVQRILGCCKNEKFSKTDGRGPES